MTYDDQLFAQVEQLPVELRMTVHSLLQTFLEKLSQNHLVLPEHPDFKVSFARVWACSQYVAFSCVQAPEMIVDLVTSGDLFSRPSSGEYLDYLISWEINTEAGLMTQLRAFRRREMVRIAWRDLAGWADLDETLGDLTALAESCIQYALEFLYEQACAKRGTPVLPDGSAQKLVVLGMGKLGAWELNYSSDIDLIFSYEVDGNLPDRKETSYEEFFSRLSRSLIKVLDQVTVDGFVFRTDIRLRPFGESGPVAMSFDGMEKYYLTQAREWERYAMVKVRPVAGDLTAGRYLMDILKPFVYRRYLDYGAFAELRTMKYAITQELQRKDRLQNIKLGPGGIREIEFIGQAFQLIRGGCEKQLQERRILVVLDEVKKLQLLPGQIVDQLKDSYCFLRQVENHIQQYQDKQTHDLPNNSLEQLILAFSMGFTDWVSFKHKLDQIRQQVQDEFEQVFSLSNDELEGQESMVLWIDQADQDKLLQHLAHLGYKQPETTLSVIEGFKNASAIKRLTTKGAGVLNRLVPALIQMVGTDKAPDVTLKRILELLEKIAGRNVYLSLLAENPDALSQLIKLSSASLWICDYLSRYPVLFDELLDTRSLYEPLNKQDLQSQLNKQISSVDIDDFEQVMNVLRQFKHINVLKVAAADIMGIFPLMVVSEYLTCIAEVILEQVVDHAWRLITEKHGTPTGKDINKSGFAILGFGKLGGVELGYGSDLDLIFLYDSLDGNALTNGQKPISNTQFYSRLGQKVMNMLNTNMLSGMLYEVDMRLRPSGNSGLLVSQVRAYETYLQNEAWTWEHQALVRGRFVAGDERVKKEFQSIRKRILSLPRDIEVLKKDVREMRVKMRESLVLKKPGMFDIKQGEGGIADIEFIVQFKVLAHAAQNEDLVIFTDNINLMEGLQKFDYLLAESVAVLKEAYCAYRDRGHRETLQGNRMIVTEQTFASMRTEVVKIWHQLLGGCPRKD